MKKILLVIMLLPLVAAAQDVTWMPGAVPVMPSPGSTLIICGTHSTFPQNLLKVTQSNIKVTGACPGNPGVIYGGSITIKGVSGVTVEHVKILGNPVYQGNTGIALVNVNNVVIRNNHVENTRYSVYAGRDSYANDVLVEDNVLIDAEEGILLAAYTENFASVKQNWTIRGNYIADINPKADQINADNEAIGVMGGRNIVIERNFITNATYGMNIWACATGILEDLRIEKNTLVEIRGGASHWPSRGIFKSCTASNAHTGVEIVDNVVVGVDNKGIRWHGGTAEVLIKNNSVAGSTGIETSGNVTLDGNKVYE